jgi:hypothetical protein
VNRAGQSARFACIAFLHLQRKSRCTDVRPTVMAGRVPATSWPAEPRGRYCGPRLQAIMT